MRVIVVFMLIIGGLCPWAFGEDQEVGYNSLVFSDPRAPRFPREVLWLRDGELVREYPADNHPLLIISWMPSPTKKNHVYQISGIEGYYSRELLDLFLKKFYQLQAAGGAGAKSPGILVAGNNWASGVELGETLKPLTKKFQFEAAFLANYGFQKASLMKEPEGRLKMIKQAFKQAEESLKKKKGE